MEAEDSGFAGQRHRRSRRADLREHAVCGLVGLAERHFLLLPTAGSLMSLGTLSADVHVTMPLKLSETTREDDRGSLAAMEDVCSWGWPCCLCGNFEFADTLGVHKQWRTGRGRVCDCNVAMEIGSARIVSACLTGFDQSSSCPSVVVGGGVGQHSAIAVVVAGRRWGRRRSSNVSPKRVDLGLQ